MIGLKNFFLKKRERLGKDYLGRIDDDINRIY